MTKRYRFSARRREAGRLRPPGHGRARAVQAGIWLQVLASLVWLPQAAVLALVAHQLAAEAATARTLALSAVGFFLLAALRSALEAWGQQLSHALARTRLAWLRRNALTALVGSSPFDPARPASGAAASALAEQAEAVTPYLSRYDVASRKTRVVPLVIAAAVAWYSWVAALVLICAAPLIPLFMALVGWKAQSASQAHLAELGTLNTYLLDRLRGLATLRGLGALPHTRRRLRALAQSLRLRTMAVLRIAFLSSAVLELFAALGVALVAVYVGFHLLGEVPFGAWGQKLTLGEGVFILLLAPAFFDPLRELAAVWHDRAAGQAGEAALAGLARDLLPLPGAAAKVPVTPSRNTPPEVCVHSLHFAYPGAATPVFEGFDLQIAAGEQVALTGASGAGKSTLLALIGALMAPQAGALAIGGQALDDASAAALRSRMAWIGQRPHFFAATLRGNVRLGRPQVDAAAMDAALGLARLDGVAARRGPSRLGEGAAGLSGGEAVRLAIARAAADPACDLILADEPTAHLDTATADAVIDSLLALAHGRTLIVATHDPRLVQRLGRTIDLARRMPCAARQAA